MFGHNYLCFCVLHISPFQYTKLPSGNVACSTAPKFFPSASHLWNLEGDVQHQIKFSVFGKIRDWRAGLKRHCFLQVVALCLFSLSIEIILTFPHISQRTPCFIIWSRGVIRWGRYLSPPGVCSTWSTVHRDYHDVLYQHSSGIKPGFQYISFVKKKKTQNTSLGWELLDYSRKANALHRKKKHFGNNPESSCGL